MLPPPDDAEAAEPITRRAVMCICTYDDGAECDTDVRCLYRWYHRIRDWWRRLWI